MACGALTAEDLRRRQSFPLDVKVRLTEERIKEWHDHWGGAVYVSYSGGKDSTVLLDIVRRIYPGVPVVFCDTGLEYPEVRELALRKADVILRPDMTFPQVIEKHGYPVPSKEQAQYIRQYRHANSEKMRRLRWEGRPPDGSFAISKKWRPLADAPFEVSEKCCDVMKKAPFKRYEKETGRAPMMATMAEESRLRMQEYLRHGCNSFEVRGKSAPMAFWTEQDVLRYIVENEIEYAGCYGEIVAGADGELHCTREDRTGCMFCMFGVHLDGEPNRFQRMQKDYPKQWDYCINKLGLGRVLDYIGVPYEREPELFDLL